MSDETYQGWTNRETWCVHLWLTNEAALYEGALVAAKAVDVFAPENVENYARNALDDEGSPCSWVLDMVNCAMARVNWSEVTEALRDA